MCLVCLPAPLVTTQDKGQETGDRNSLAIHKKGDNTTVSEAAGYD